MPPPGVAGGPPPGYQAPPGPQPRKGRRGLVITSIVLGVVLLLCAGGIGAILLSNRGGETGEGAAKPDAAVDRFLSAVYTDQDATAASAIVCGSARDSGEIGKKIRSIHTDALNYTNPRFRWDPPKIEEENAERAVVSVKVVMTTADDKTAEQDLRFTVIQDSGWWVCEVG